MSSAEVTGTEYRGKALEVFGEHYNRILISITISKKPLLFMIIKLRFVEAILRATFRFLIWKSNCRGQRIQLIFNLQEEEIVIEFNTRLKTW